MVTWHHHFILTTAAEEAWSQGDPHGPMLKILSTAGYEVEKETTNDYSPHDLVVTGRTQPAPWWDWFTTQFEERHARLRARQHGI